MPISLRRDSRCGVFRSLLSIRFLIANIAPSCNFPSLWLCKKEWKWLNVNGWHGNRSEDHLQWIRRASSKYVHSPRCNQWPRHRQQCVQLHIVLVPWFPMNAANRAHYSTDLGEKNDLINEKLLHRRPSNLTICINWSECPDIMLSMSDGLLIKFRKSPNVFIMTLVSESLSSWNIRSVPSVLIIFVLMCSSVLKHMFIRAHVPLRRSAISECCVNWHSNSMAPNSTIGSLAGENSSNRLQMVDVTTVSNSLDGLPDERAISGRQTKWSWNVVRNCCTERDSECKHRTAAKRTSALGSPRPARTLSMMLSLSMILLRISSSLAPNDAKHRNAPWRGAAAEQRNKPLNDMINWLLMAAKRCNSESIWKINWYFSLSASVQMESRIDSLQLNRLAFRPTLLGCLHRIRSYKVVPNTATFCKQYVRPSNTMNPIDVCRSSIVRPLSEFPECVLWMSKTPANRESNGPRGCEHRKKKMNVCENRMR